MILLRLTGIKLVHTLNWYEELFTTWLCDRSSSSSRNRLENVSAAREVSRFLFRNRRVVRFGRPMGT